MPQAKQLTQRVFQVHNDNEFNELAIDLFHFQIKNNKVYRDFVDYLGVKTSSVDHYSLIPFLPIELFKSHEVKTGDFRPEIIFTSSGTTGMSASQHFVKEAGLYRESFSKTFRLFFGDPEQYTILALLPAYLEREGSSLVFMVDDLIMSSPKKSGGFFLNNQEMLAEQLRQLKYEQQKVILFGVSFALVDFVTNFPMEFPDLIVIETGGMKGRRKEMVRQELHDILKKGFGVQHIFSEYGMTELLSQAYSKGEGIYHSPPWLKLLVRDMNDPLSLLPEGKTGGINVVDLANIYSCAFIATQDLGRVDHDGGFEVLGRFDNSDARGCNLMLV